MALVVITGGARSGKSSAAQRLAQLRQLDGVDVTVAVFGRAMDEEMRERIERHRADRPVGFETIEVTTEELERSGISGWLTGVEAERLVVIDCLGTLLGLLMERVWSEVAAGGLADADADTLPPGFDERVAADLDEVVSAIIGRNGDSVVVTNEVGSGIVPAWASARLFGDLLGAANRRLVDRGDAAYLAVAGRLLPLSQLARTISWPVD